MVLRKYMKTALSGMALAALTLVACNKDFSDVDPRPITGERVHTVLSLDISAPSSNVLTRADYGKTQAKLRNIWIGIFDTSSGELVGWYVNDGLKGSSGDTAFTIGQDSGKYTFNDIDIWYYDSNPEVYIAGVANYDGVDARLAGESELVELSELLGIGGEGESAYVDPEKVSWESFRRISVDAASADANTDSAGYYYLLSGFFTTSHDHNAARPTIDYNGDASAARVSLTEDGAYSAHIKPEGVLCLRRLLSEITVNILVGDPDDGTHICNIENLYYKVVNNPREVYLMEHATDKRGGNINAIASSYLARTANSADFLEYGNDGRPVDENGGYDSTDWIRIEGEFDRENWYDNSYTFTYQHYENKHWGLDWPLGGVVFRNMEDVEYPNGPATTWTQFVTSAINYFGPSSAARYTASNAAHSIREHKINIYDDPETALFRTLVSDSRHRYNNNASFIILKADMMIANSDGSTSKGSVQYIVHEGFTSLADGRPALQIWSDRGSSSVRNVSDITDPICDYQCIRNTSYTYNLVISGMNRIAAQASASDDYFHNDGYTGQILNITPVKEISPEGNVREGNSGSEGIHYTIEDPTGSYNFPDFAYVQFPQRLGMGAERMEQYIKTLKWRLYEIDADGNEYNFGTWEPNDEIDSQIDWPQINTPIYNPNSDEGIPEDLIDKYYELYNAILLRTCRWNHFASNEGWTPYEVDWYDHDRTMRIEGFMNLTSRDYNLSHWSFPFFYIQMSEYDPEEEDYQRQRKYKRGFYLGTPTADEDGCISLRFQGVEQRAVDNRPKAETDIELLLDDHWSADVDIWHPQQGICAAPNTVTYVSWIDHKQIATAYRFQIEDLEPIIVDAATYRNSDGVVRFPYSVKDTYYYEQNHYGNNYFTVNITPLYDPDGQYYPEGDTYTPTQGQGSGFYGFYLYNSNDDSWGYPGYDTPKWSFTEQRNPIYGYVAYFMGNTQRPGRMEWNGLTLIGGNATMQAINSNNTCCIEISGSGSPDMRAFMLTVDKPGSIIVECENNENKDDVRGFYLQIGKDGPRIFKEATYAAGRTELTFSAREIEDAKPITGITELYIYPQNRMRIFSITWDLHRRQDLSKGSSFYLTDHVWDYNNPLHPRVDVRNSDDHYATRYFTTYIGFGDSYARAEEYILEFYDQSGSKKLEARVDAKKYTTYEGHDHMLNYPLHVTLEQGEYSVYITATGNSYDYISGEPTLVSDKLIVRPEQSRYVWNVRNSPFNPAYFPPYDPEYPQTVTTISNKYLDFCYFMEYAGMSVVGSDAGSPVTISNDINLARGGSFDHNCIRFIVSKPGTFTVSLTSPGGERTLSFATSESVLSTQSVPVATTEISFETGSISGPTEFAIYGSDRLTIHQVAFELK